MGETLKYLLVGPEEITLETIEVHVFIKTLHNKLIILIILFTCTYIMIHVFYYVQINSRSSNEFYEIVSLIRYLYQLYNILL